MKPSEIISVARRQTGCTEDIVTKEEAYRFLNFIIEDFGAEIRLSDAGYGLQIKEVPISAGQQTYNLGEDEDVEDHTFAMDKILKVGINGSDGEYREIPVRFVSEIKINDIIKMGEPQVAFLQNNTLTLVPAPVKDCNLFLFTYSKNFELVPDEEGQASTDLEENIWIPKRWHYVLVEGLKYRMYGNMGVGFEQIRVACRQAFDSEKLKAIQQLTDRGQMAEVGENPNLDYFA